MHFHLHVPGRCERHGSALGAAGGLSAPAVEFGVDVGADLSELNAEDEDGDLGRLGGRDIRYVGQGGDVGCFKHFVVGQDGELHGYVFVCDGEWAA